MIRFIYGTMGAGKTEALIREYRMSPNKNFVCCLAVNPMGGWGKKIISRNGDSIKCSPIATLDEISEIVDEILIDEAQFLTKSDIQKLLEIERKFPMVKIMCYGLLTNFRGELFEGAKALLEEGAKLQEIAHLCDECSRYQAFFNARFDLRGKMVTNGDEIFTNKNCYKSLCYLCYEEAKRR